MSDAKPTPVPLHSSQGSARRAPYPFNRPDADLILRSSDSVDFLVHSTLLVLASFFFQLILSGPPMESTGQAGHDARPIIAVSEDSTTLELLLAHIYPMHLPVVDTISDLEDIERVYKVAQKYEMELVLHELQKKLSAAISKDPFRGWAAAVRLGIEPCARQAAGLMYKLAKRSSSTYLPEMEDVPALSYHSLLSF
ncbi:hypothetical protein C8Q76DRAFT_586528, partial [Earliella scabrosa]